jgi:hypothetical protein
MTLIAAIDPRIISLFVVCLTECANLRFIFIYKNYNLYTASYYMCCSNCIYLIGENDTIKAKYNYNICQYIWPIIFEAKSQELRIFSGFLLILYHIEIS